MRPSEEQIQAVPSLHKDVMLLGSKIKQNKRTLGLHSITRLMKNNSRAIQFDSELNLKTYMNYLPRIGDHHV